MEGIKLKITLINKIKFFLQKHLLLIGKLIIVTFILEFPYLVIGLALKRYEYFEQIFKVASGRQGVNFNFNDIEPS